MNVRSIICIWTLALVAITVAVPLVEKEGVLDAHPPPIVEAEVVDGAVDLGEDSRDGLVDSGYLLDTDGFPFAMDGQIDHQVISSLPAFVPMSDQVMDETSFADGILDVAYLLQPVQPLKEVVVADN